MKLIRTEDAAGQVLCHDITQIIPGEFKGPRFRKGHIVQPEDIPVLLSIGKENLYVWEKKPGILHEDEAAALLYKAAAGKNIHGTEPKEGKIELIADCDGLLKINREALLAVNRTPQMMIATIHGDLPVKKGQKLAGTRIIPLVIEQEKMDAMQAAAGSEPILNVLPMQAKKFAVITTGSGRQPRKWMGCWGRGCREKDSRGWYAAVSAPEFDSNPGKNGMGQIWVRTKNHPGAEKLWSGSLLSVLAKKQC